MFIGSHRHEICSLLNSDSHQFRCSNFQNIGETFQRYTLTWDSIGNRVILHVLQYNVVFIIRCIELTETRPSLSRSVVTCHVHQEVPVTPAEDKPVVISLFNEQPVHNITQLFILANVNRLSIFKLRGTENAFHVLIVNRLSCNVCDSVHIRDNVALFLQFTLRLCT